MKEGCTDKAWVQKWHDWFRIVEFLPHGTHGLTNTCDWPCASYMPAYTYVHLCAGEKGKRAWVIFRSPVFGLRAHDEHHCRLHTLVQRTSKSALGRRIKASSQDRNIGSWIGTLSWSSLQHKTKNINVDVSPTLPYCTYPINIANDIFTFRMRSRAVQVFDVWIF